jgi:DNA-binding NarL/FixJ family response regulator
MRVLLADNQEKVRSALRLVIDQEPGFIVVGEVTDPDELSVSIEECHPDLLLLDWELLPSEKKTSIRLLMSKFPHLYVIAMSACVMTQHEALAAGANAFLSKVEPVEKFIMSLRHLSTIKMRS